MRALDRLAMDISYVFELAGSLRHTMTLEEALPAVEQQLAARSESFLDILDRAVYANPQSPYYKLLAHAGAELGDIRREVQQTGLERTLEKLYDAGVYVTSEEMKGRQPIQRNGIEISTSPSDFDNPLSGRPQVVGASSGLTGRSTTFSGSLKSIPSGSRDLLVGILGDLGDRPIGYWTPDFVIALLWYVKVGRPPAKLFYTNKLPWTSFGVRQMLLLNYTRLVSRVLGRPLPAPEIASRGQAVKIAEWLAEMSARGRPAAMLCHANPAVRICLAALEHGLDISRTLFIVFGEPFTPGKASVLSSAGAEARVSYAMSEAGVIGRGCAHATELDDVHFYAHRLALIQRAKAVSSGESVGALIYTTVHPDNTKVLLNAESGDYANVTRRECPCLMGRVGFNTHLHGIRSYEKLTSDGVTFMGSRLYDLVEQVLPAQFGGTINDYQLVEEEQPDGLARASLIVSPSVGPIDENALVATVMKTLGRTHSEPGGEEMVEQWRQAATLRVIRRQPYETASMKVAPLYVQRRSAP
ncbi:MAG TPA: hypothetical protein VI759_06940 [Dehalococcoidia bacterium]|nr:hypothetical protein [Dehalococcoidia bacterium]